MGKGKRLKANREETRGEIISLIAPLYDKRMLKNEMYLQTRKKLSELIKSKGVTDKQLSEIRAKCRAEGMSAKQTTISLINGLSKILNKKQ